MTTPSKDTTPKGDRKQRYRVDGRAFINGASVAPSDDPLKPNYVYGPPGQHGKNLVAVDEAGRPIPVPQRAKPVPTGKGTEVDRLRQKLDAAFAEIEQIKAQRQDVVDDADQIAAAETAIADLQARLDEMRVADEAHKVRIAELEKQLEDATKPPVKNGK